MKLLACGQKTSVGRKNTLFHWKALLLCCLTFQHRLFFVCCNSNSRYQMSKKNHQFNILYDVKWTMMWEGNWVSLVCAVCVCVCFCLYTYFPRKHTLTHILYLSCEFNCARWECGWRCRRSHLIEFVWSIL